MKEYIWVFNGERSSFPSGLFSSLASAESWILNYKLTGVLTKYPIDVGAYDYAVELNHFTPRREDQRTSSFIGKFSCASFEHYHYENGLRD